MTVETDSAYDVFISYGRQDGRAVAERLRQALEARGISAWYDRRTVAANQDFGSDLEMEISRAAHVVICLTPSLATSGTDDSFVLRELLYAQSLEKSITPLIFPGFPPHSAPRLIQHLQPLHFAIFEDSVAELADRLQSETYVASDIYDPFHDYLNESYRQTVDFLENDLYQQVVEFLDTTVFSFVEFVPAGTSAALMTFDTFAEAFEYYAGRVMLFGGAGSGKTITLTAFAREALSRRLADPTQPLP
ncbi:MAG: toll/interleukin-1 receptor domain-containing protein, partial [Anaerolineae bacterium]|nr:toll/interleukin-1 receptor domain-containing protein [Anaerolineae bacterium]